MHSGSENKNFPPFSAWWQAARPAFYIATLIPLFLAYILAGKESGVWQPGLFFLILSACFFLHLATNLANDYFDHTNGVDQTETIGGSRALQEGKIPLPTYRKALIFLYGATLVFTFIGVLYTGRTALWSIIGFAFFCSYFYVAPPIRYGYHALGEVFVFLSMGVTMTTGCYYALLGVWSGKAFALSIAIGLMVAGILYFQSLPEIYTDKAAGKNTLSNTLGPKKATVLFKFWWPFIWLLLILYYKAGLCEWPIFLGIVATYPLYRKALFYINRAKDSNNWLPLDAHGHLIRKMYFICGLSIIIAVTIR